MRSTPTPLTESQCFRLATAYLARRAASKLQLRRYLLRKLRRAEAGADRSDDTAETLVETVLGKLERLQLIDETSLAQSRARTLAGKGYSAGRLRTHLSHQGFDVRDPAIAPSLDVKDEAQALRYAQRKRLGPYAVDQGRSSFERDMRALLRVGFAVDVARRVLTGPRSGEPITVEQPDVNEF